MEQWWMESTYTIDSVVVQQEVYVIVMLIVFRIDLVVEECFCRQPRQPKPKGRH
jgi:hypothetical protein